MPSAYSKAEGGWHSRLYIPGGPQPVESYFQGPKNMFRVVKRVFQVVKRFFQAVENSFQAPKRYFQAPENMFRVVKRALRVLQRPFHLPKTPSQPLAGPSQPVSPIPSKRMGQKQLPEQQLPLIVPASLDFPTRKSPASSLKCAISSVVERLLHTQEVAGSNPASRTISSAPSTCA